MLKTMFSLSEQEETISDFLDVIEVNDEIRDIKTVFDDIALKHSILPENIIGHIKEFDDSTVIDDIVS